MACGKGMQPVLGSKFRVEFAQARYLVITLTLTPNPNPNPDPNPHPYPSP